MESKDIITVSALTKHIKDRLISDPKLINILVKGEISNYKRHSSGHIYFTLKDEESQIKCLMFNRSASLLKFKPEDGMKVVVLSSITVYERHGDYELIISEVYPDGIGALHQRFLQLKEKLGREGLFDEKHKKKIPKFPRTVGIITSPTGAVIKDLITNLTRRFPIINIKIASCLVQGIDASKDIARAITLINKTDVDVIILARGGGSEEDLWCFNEEVVARAIFNSKIPVISAIGHETDFTIADFVADLRVATPSTAAEIAVPDKDELFYKLFQLKERLAKRPSYMINQYLQRIDEVMIRFDNSVKNALRLKWNKLEIMDAKLHSLNPKGILARGYSITLFNEKIVRSFGDVKANDIIKTIINKGEIKSKIMEAKNGV